MQQRWRCGLADHDGGVVILRILFECFSYGVPGHHNMALRSRICLEDARTRLTHWMLPIYCQEASGTNLESDSVALDTMLDPYLAGRQGQTAATPHGNVVGMLEPPWLADDIQ